MKKIPSIIQSQIFLLILKATSWNLYLNISYQNHLNKVVFEKNQIVDLVKYLKKKNIELRSLTIFYTLKVFCQNQYLNKLILLTLFFKIYFLFLNDYVSITSLVI